MSDCTEMRDPTGQFILGPEYAPPNKNRFVVEVPDKFATARWSRDADVATIARCILATLKYEPHAVDTTVLRRALEGVIEHTTRAGISEKQEETKTMTDEQKTVSRSGDPMTVEQWLAIRKEAALRIDPETAEVEWIYADIGDPYGVHNLPEEGLCVGRVYFARSPESDIWVCFDDLPEMVRDALWDRHSAKLAFPAGLEALPRQTASDLERE